MTTPRFKVEFEGFNELDRLFGELADERKVRAVQRQVINFAMTPTLKTAKANAPEDSGALKFALEKKVGTTKDKQRVYGIVGVDSKKSVIHEGKVRRPSKYIHLVENGFVARDGRYIPGKHLLKKAQTSTIAEMASRYEQKLKQAVDKQLDKARAKAGIR